MKLEIEQLEEVASHQDYLVSVIEHLTNQQSQEGPVFSVSSFIKIQQ